jgi:MFS transporter, putative metabolite:H+ symporter
MFFDGYDLYVASSVLAATIGSRFSTLAQNLQFTSLALGMTICAFAADFIGRAWSIIGASIISIVAGSIYAGFSAASDPAIVLSVGFVLVVAIHVQTAILFGVYTPELFPTEVRLRANGICNTLGRLATVFHRSSWVTGCKPISCPASSA